MGPPIEILGGLWERRGREDGCAWIGWRFIMRRYYATISKCWIQWTAGRFWGWPSFVSTFKKYLLHRQIISSPISRRLGAFLVLKLPLGIVTNILLKQWYLFRWSHPFDVSEQVLCSREEAWACISTTGKVEPDKAPGLIKDYCARIPSFDKSITNGLNRMTVSDSFAKMAFFIGFPPFLYCLFMKTVIQGKSRVPFP